MDQKIANKKKNSKSLMALTQIGIMIISIFAFSFIIGGMIVFASQKVEAVDFNSQKGCCLEAIDGAICQEMFQFESQNCKTNLIATSCNTVDNCRTGCCYNPSEGICSLNSPKEQCISNNGNWSSDATCNIPECQVGCCLIGDQASITTTRECTKISRDFNVEKNFQALDEDETCNSKIGLSAKGACTTPSSDYSGENDCRFTTKQQCAGEFHEGLLCTAPSLKTNCFPAQNTTCVEGLDQVYYLDTCGNLANVYDSSKINDTSYWTAVLDIQDPSLCIGSAKDCGNCDYLQGSRCYSVRTGQDQKPTYGENICRNLNCVNGKKNGESWCLSDYSNQESLGVAPVGSRFFRAICNEGQISVEPCVDYNQEICIQNTASGDSNTEFSEARCIPNDWRSCIAANEKESYAQVQNECKQYPQCTMYLDIPGNEKYKDLAGFKIGVQNSEQGNSNNLADDANSVIAHCVPIFTPGMVFWRTAEQTAGNTTRTTQSQAASFSGLDSGGSYEETKAICALGSFTCITKYAKYNALDSWHVKDNAECYLDTDPTKTLTWYEGLSDRCSKIGPCGVKVNIAGQIGSNNETTISVNKLGDSGNLNPESSAGYVLNDDYKSSLASRAGIIAPGTLKSFTSMLFAALITGNAINPPPSFDPSPGPTYVDPTAAAGIDGTGVGASSSSATSALPSTGAPTGSAGGGSGVVAGTPGFITIASSMLTFAAAGYAIGQLVGKLFKLSGPQTQSLSYSLAAGGLVTGTMVTTKGATAFGLWLAKIGGITGFCWICVVIVLIVMILTYVFTYTDQKYYATSYTCEPWQPPLQGDCSACNGDVRTCSEYRCKSLGQNCHYYNENGEPGYCATLADTWSAKISPWQEILTEGNEYTDVASNRFTIKSKTGDGNIEAWAPLVFGIVTDDPAECRIDNRHTESFDQMSTQMVIGDTNCQTGFCSQTQGQNHKISLSPHLGANITASSTLGIVTGENNFYIRCKNFAGQTNAAEFAVRINVGAGPDLTPPIINSFQPTTNSYMKAGINSNQVVLYVNEPSQCKYSQGVDNRFEEMTGNVSCLYSPSAAIFGNWPCFANLTNFQAGANNFYFQCKDQPNIEEWRNASQNINRASKSYTLNLCETGLNITGLEPKNMLVTGRSPISLEINATTSGCIEGGKAVCSFSLDNGFSIAFSQTNARVHKQLFTSMPSGEHNITVSCIDDAGNTANQTLEFDIYLDNQAPIVTRTYNLNNKLTILTNENSNCKYTTNSSLGCDFNFENSLSMENANIFHYLPWQQNTDYYIKCSDVYNNTLAGCNIILKTY
jgi:hypothetical protein